MSIFNVISLAGGLALFLYGMTIMGNGLERLAGSKLEGLLTRATSNIFKSVLLGAVITAVIQSSTATTILVVGLVNSGILKFRRSIGIIMGANIGTTVTAQIIALSDLSSDNFLLQFFKPTTLTPLFGAIGIIFFLFMKEAKHKNLGSILIGFSILFTGVTAMEHSMTPLADSPVFVEILAALSNPILGVIAGTLITALIQSSSASVGILQAVSTTGALRFNTAMPIIMGQNIGTCLTALLSSLGANKNAKRAAMVHLYFNLIGTIAFLIGVYGIQYTVGLPFWNTAVGRGEIANFHTIFNLVSTFALLPFYKFLGFLAEKTVRDKPGEEELTPDIPPLDERLLLSPSLAIEQCRTMLEQMSRYAQKNYSRVLPLLFEYDSKQAENLNEYESAIDRMEVALSQYLLKLTNMELSEEDARTVNEMFWLVTEFERIGDYAVNIMDRGGEMHDKKIKLSDIAKTELTILDGALKEIIDLSVSSFRDHDVYKAQTIEPLEQTIDMVKELLKNKHIKRLKTGECSIDAGVIFLEILTYMERIADHCSNVAAYIVGYEGEKRGEIDVHNYRRELHKGNEHTYNELFEKYSEKYKVEA